jgi:hypothetical protein
MHFLEAIWDDQPGDYFFFSTKSPSGKWNDYFVTRKQVKDIGRMLEEHEGKNLYFCPHGFSRPRRIKQNAVAPKLLFSDMDEVDPRRTKPRPTIAIESSPGRYVGLWRTDKPITEELNQRLAYSIGADKNGWDFSQVLRIPGTRNYKYQGQPRVKLLWSDGPKYKVAELEASVPRMTDDAAGGVNEDAATVFKKWSPRMSFETRALLLQKKTPAPGKRSEVLFKLGNELLETGMTEDEALVLLMNCVWNKFAGYKDGGERALRRQLTKSVGKAFRNKPTGSRIDPKLSSHEERDGNEEVDELWDAAVQTDEHGRLKLNAVTLFEAEERNIDWLYYPYCARGELTIIEGDPQVGKSYFTQAICKAFCEGDRLPCVRPYKPVVGKVLYFDLENDTGSVTKKRMKWNGMTDQGMKNWVQVDSQFSVHDADARRAVYNMIEDHQPLVVVFDTLMTYLGKTDVHKSSEASQVAAWFRQLARRYGCAVIVLRHLTKNGKGPALMRGQGSASFVGMARLAVTIGYHPEDSDVRVAALTKASNISKDNKVVSYTIESLPDTVKEQDRSRLVWQDLIEMDADEMLQSNADPEKLKGGKQNSYWEAWLKQALEDEGRIDSKTLFKRAEKWAEKEGHTWNVKALRRAAKKIGVEFEEVGQKGGGRTSFWVAPKFSA